MGKNNNAPSGNNKITVVLTVVLGVVLVAIIVFIILALLGKAYIGLGSFGIGRASNGQVCNNDDVTKYNTTMGYEDETGQAKAEQTLDDLVKSIKNKPNNDKDATCQYILWQYAYATDDKAAQKTYYESLVRLNDQGIYANNRIQNPYNLDSIKVLTDENQPVEERGEG
jgi:hypothetical protein